MSTRTGLSHQSPGQRRGGRAGGSGPGTHRLPRAALEKPDLQRVFVHHANEGHIGAIGEARMPFELGAHLSPVEIEIADEYGALRIADVQDHALMARRRG